MARPGGGRWAEGEFPGETEEEERRLFREEELEGR